MPYKISCLLFIKDLKDRLLLLKRKKAPNLGKWSPPGGKLETSLGESPMECGIREAKEELGISLKNSDLNLFGYVSEKNYEGENHWMMFLIEVLLPLEIMPDDFEEGSFGVFGRDQIDALDIPQMDHKLIWPFYDKRNLGFWGIRADFSSTQTKIKIEANPLK